MTYDEEWTKSMVEDLARDLGNALYEFDENNISKEDREQFAKIMVLSKLADKMQEILNEGLDW